MIRLAGCRQCRFGCCAACTQRWVCLPALQVLEAIKGLRTMYAGKGARLVPLKERPAAVTVNRQAKAAIERDSWVRVRGGLYKDDLAKVRCQAMGACHWQIYKLPLACLLRELDRLPSAAPALPAHNLHLLACFVTTTCNHC